MSFEISLHDPSLKLDAASAEKSIASFGAQIVELGQQLDAARQEYTKFVDASQQHSRAADEIEAGMASLMREGGNTDKTSLQAAGLRVKARAATRAGEMALADIQRIENALQVRQAALMAAERSRAGIVLRAKAQEYALEIIKLRPMIAEMMDLAGKAGTSVQLGYGLVPNFAVPEVAGLRFDLLSKAKPAEASDDQ
ncbi:hypothetical protein [Paraburkholderia terrae]|uniref:hypothetical protein n=1 Tax=Paraburkholderia terrae TaxID=311230 RepID=UPI00206649A5|nr:hypothetical protein [Paraburkholderia terrae]BDC38934.1 hypothetical protein PTKU15_22310 [Paraburkholderia terrae]